MHTEVLSNNMYDLGDCILKQNLSEETQCVPIPENAHFPDITIPPPRINHDYVFNYLTYLYPSPRM